ncbi:MAG: response regulator [Oscillospiraceae bacterium]|jgi:DNA-binding response OmpR family regulator|nr:response regulator [Oscillospiraceae bacterium]
MNDNVNRNEFLAELRRRLAHLPPIETERAVGYFCEILDDREEDGMTEAEAVASLPSIDAIVADVQTANVYGIVPSEVNVLVVADDAVMHEMVCRRLTDAGYSVVTAQSSTEAHAKLQGSTFDLIISSAIDGFEFAQSVRASDKATPILLVSARRDNESIVRAFRFGVDDYLVKPFNVDELVLRVAALARRALLNKK